MNKLINKDAVSVIQERINNNQFTINPCDISNKKIRIDKVCVYVNGRDSFIQIDEDMNKLYIEKWMDSVGGMLYRDAKKSVIEDYYLIKTGTVSVLVKRVDIGLKDSMELNGDLVLTTADYAYFVIKIMKSEFSWLEYERDFMLEIEVDEDESVDEDDDSDDEDEVVNSLLDDSDYGY